MTVIELLQMTMSILVPITLWLVNKAYEEGKADRAQIIQMLENTRSRQDKIEERIYKLELEFDMLDNAPTFLRKPDTHTD